MSFYVFLRIFNDVVRDGDSHWLIRFQMKRALWILHPALPGDLSLWFVHQIPRSLSGKQKKGRI